MPATHGQLPAGQIHDDDNEGGPVRRAGRRLRAISDSTRSAIGRMSDEQTRSRQQTDHYEDSVVDYLDVLGQRRNYLPVLCIQR